MGFLIERRADETTEMTQIQKLFSLGDLGEVDVSRDKIMNIAAISSAIELISSIISMLDFKLYKKIDKTKIEEIEDDRLRLLNIEPNFLMNATQLKKAMVVDMIIDGCSYINIEKTRNEFKNLYYVESSKVGVQLDSEPIHKDAKLTISGKEYEIYDFIISTLNTLDGVQGKGILKNNKDLLALALLEQNYINKNYKNGGAGKGIWRSEKKLGDIEFKQFKQDAKDIKSNDEEIILNSTVDYKPISASNKDMQTLESRQFINEELRNIFNIPKTLDEEGFKSLVKIVLNPYVNSIVSAINKSLLLEDEKKTGYFFQMDLSELTKADVVSRFNAYKTSLDCGIESLNEIRMKENLEPVEGLDIHKMTIGQALYNSKDGTWFIPNTGLTTKDGEVIDNADNKESKGNNTEQNTGTEGTNDTQVSEKEAQNN